MKKPMLKTFQGEKLKFIREMYMETLVNLGEHLGVSHQLVSAWENNIKKPTFEWILKLADFFSVERSFFFIPLPNSNLDEDAVFFRKKAAVAKKYQTSVKLELLKFMSIENEFREMTKLPVFEYPIFSDSNPNFRQIDFDEIEKNANLLRHNYGLGDGPISNMTLFCEKIGIRVQFVDMSSTQVDAITSFVSGCPVILINNDRKSSVRIRFNLAHELGHILMHLGYKKTVVNDTSKHKRIEAEANHFASCFLLPEEGFLLDLTSTNMNHLIQLKQHWKVSIQAIVYRATNMGVISEKQALFLYQQISRNKWRKKEPLDDEIPVEYPTMLKTAIRYLKQQNVDVVSEISRNTGYREEELNDLFNYGLEPSKKNYLSVVK